MTDRRNGLHGLAITAPALALGLSLIPASLAGAESRVAAPAVAPDWCHLDAPGAFLAARQDAARGDEGPTHVACPALAPAQTFPARLVLPLPCERAIEFSRIDTPARTILDDREANLGGANQSNLRLRYTQGLWRDAIAGGFTVSDQGGPTAPSTGHLTARSYYIAAYELTELQYGLLSSGALAAFSGADRPTTAQGAAVCEASRRTAAEIRTGQVLPARELSWFDAVAFVRALNAYLMAEDKRRVAEGLDPLVPWEQGTPGFVRLPSEAEWEFAARGGDEAGAAGTGGSRTYLVQADDGNRTRIGSLEEVAIISDAMSRSVIKSIGRKAPNLFGLYDTIGNVAEITHDLFRLTRPDRLHGLRGGYILRGGHALTPRANLSVAHRAEETFYDSRGEGRTPFSGVRLALVAPVFVSGRDPEDPYHGDLRNAGFDAALAAAHDALTEQANAPGADHRRTVRSLLGELGAVSSPDEMAALVSDLEQALDASEAALNQAKDRQLEQAVRSAAIGAYAVRSASRVAYILLLRIEEHQEEIENMKGMGVPESKYKEVRKRVDKLMESWRDREEHVSHQIRYLLSSLVNLSEVDEEEMARAFELVGSDFNTKKLTIFHEDLINVRNVVDQVREQGADKIFERFASLVDDTREARIKRFGVDLE